MQLITVLEKRILFLLIYCFVVKIRRVPELLVLNTFTRSIHHCVFKKKNNLECKFIFWHEFRTKNTFVLSPYRLPIIQGATAAFLMPVFALMSQPEWRCPFDDEANGMNLLIFCNKYTLSVNTHGGIEIRLHRCLRTLSTLHFRFRPQG